MKKLNYLFLITLLFLILFNFLVERDYSKPNTEFLPGMIESIPFNSQSANNNFADGKTFRETIPGTIPNNFSPIDFKATPEDAIRAGKELTNPLLKNDDELAKGEKIYFTFCTPCHGATGNGDGVVAQRGFPPPPSFFADRAMSLKEGQMFHILTFGQNNMPPLASQIPQDDRWRVIQYVQKLQSQKKN